MHIRLAIPLLASATLGSCGGFFFSRGIEHPERSRPVALIETRGQASRLGATTTEGIVFLNEPSATGACRVHFFLGGDLIVDDGTVVPFGGVYALADIDLKTQAVPVLTRELTAEDELVALVLVDDDVERIRVRLANGELARGDALIWPGYDLPAGTGIFRVRTDRHAGELEFVGLATGLVTLSDGDSERRFVTFAGPARMREAMSNPKPLFTSRKVKHRPDGVSVQK